MKKITLVAAALAAAFAIASCDNSENAELIVYNTMNHPVASLSLSGPEDTGNILDGELAADEVRELSVGIEPGTYSWRVEYAGGIASYYDSAEHGIEVELFPGRNNLKIQEGGGL